MKTLTENSLPGTDNRRERDQIRRGWTESEKQLRRLRAAMYQNQLLTMLLGQQSGAH